MPRREMPDRETLVRAVRYARLPGHGHTVAEARAKFGISTSAWRRAVRELGEEAAIRSDEDLVLSGLHPGGPTSLERLAYYYSWINHAGIGEDALRAILERLVARGDVRRVGEKYELAREWP